MTKMMDTEGFDLCEFYEDHTMFDINLFSPYTSEAGEEIKDKFYLMIDIPTDFYTDTYPVIEYHSGGVLSVNLPDILEEFMHNPEENLGNFNNLADLLDKYSSALRSKFLELKV